MKKTLLLFFILATYFVNAQDREELITQAFSKVKVSSGIVAKVFPHAKENKVVISGIDKDEVNIRIRRDELRVSLPLNSLFSNTETTVEIYLVDFSSIEATSSANLSIEGSIKQSDLFLKAVEMAKITAKVELDSLEAQIFTGGEITLQGKANSQLLTLKTGGSFDGKNLKSEHAEVEVSYGGFALVYTTLSCTAKVIAGGEISVYGNPKEFTESTQLGGIVKKVFTD